MTHKDWLKTRIETLDAKEAAKVDLRELGAQIDIDQILTGELLSRWAPEWGAFVSQMQPGDEIWYFKSPEESWRNLCGRAGFVILRAGEPFAVITTAMN